MKTIAKEQLEEILKSHSDWFKGEGGERANLSWADLSGADLSRANLSWANLSGANLSGADLSGANLSVANLSYANLSGAKLSCANLFGANLSGAKLHEANLSGADLSRANLSWADLFGTNLSRANLSGANLSWADLSGANLSRANLSGASLSGTKFDSSSLAKAISLTTILPDGDLIGWKKLANGTVCKLLIPKRAKRSNSTGRKCRAEFVKVLEGEGNSVHDGSTEYKVGRIVRCDKWEDDRWVECGGGIHFFITREEAKSYLV